MGCPLFSSWLFMTNQYVKMNSQTKIPGGQGNLGSGEKYSSEAKSPLTTERVVGRKKWKSKQSLGVRPGF